jgi:putative polyhydroxyalkanoate system protein
MMADISVRREHSVARDVLRGRLEDLVGGLARKYGLKASWTGDTCNLSGAGIKQAVLRMGGADVSLDITLGLMGRMLKPTIEREIEKKMDGILAPVADA